MSKVYLHIGSNMGDRLSFLKQAELGIQKRLGGISRKSKVYETEAWGDKDQEAFLNQVLVVQSNLSGEQLLKITQDIENQIGRQKTGQWGPRQIDIDILLIGNKVIKTKDLTVPHPRMHERNFVLVPLMEVAPDELHPIFQKSVEELFDTSKDTSEVYLFED